MKYEQYLKEAKDIHKDTEQTADLAMINRKNKVLGPEIITAQARVSQIKKAIQDDTIKTNKQRIKFEKEGKSYKESCNAVLDAAEQSLKELKDLQKRLQKKISDVDTETIVVDGDIVSSTLSFNVKSQNWGSPDESRPIDMKIKLDIYNTNHEDKIVTNEEYTNESYSKLMKATREEIKNTMLSIYTKMDLYFKKIGLKYWTNEEISNFDSVKNIDFSGFFDEFGDFDLEKEEKEEKKEIESKPKKEKEEPKEKISLSDLIDDL